MELSMFKLNTFTVLPTVPTKLKPLLEMANNLWFSWNKDAFSLFEKIEPEIWEECGNNPIKLICNLPQKRMEEIAKDDEFVNELNTIYASFTNYMESKTWYEGQYGKKPEGHVAYFSCEFGLHESLPIYSGGLGVLSGDHLKSASDLGVPLVAVGLLYREGYFRQGLDPEGLQQEFYPKNEWFSLPIIPIKDQDGQALKLKMKIGDETIFYQIWKVQVGRNPLILLDTDLPENNEHQKTITQRLYVADRDTRLKQEILLGIGGVKALRYLGFRPSCYHINEGHSAFLILERLRTLMKSRDLSFNEAREIIWASNIFTTHTPVAAGNELFKQELIKKYLETWVKENLSLDWEDFVALGLKDPKSKTEEFCLTILALRFSSLSNGVSKLHGEVSKEMWKELWPELPIREVPIGHITNGVHTATWMSGELEKIMSRFTPRSYVKELADFNIWKIVDEIPDHTLWKIHNERKKALIDYARDRLRFQLQRRGANADEINRIKSILDPEVLTIGFARRFAPYKRGALLFRDMEKLKKLVTDPNMPVQFIFAGKAHPADDNGKKIIKTIFQALIDHPEFSKRIIFLEDYDMDMARYLVQGVDVWLNTPRRPLEASGTSGMKAAINGAPNLSVLDGWWDEAFDQTHGWAIGHGEMYKNLEHQDDVESTLIYRLITKEIAPLYYEKDEESNLPLAWITMMKKTIKACGQDFNAHRMVCDYITHYYNPAEQLHIALTENACNDARMIADLNNKLRKHWKDIKIIEVSKPEQEVVLAGNKVEITAKMSLGQIKPDEIFAEVYHGQLSPKGVISTPKIVKMEVIEHTNSQTVFKAMIPCDLGGQYAYTIRIRPGNENLENKLLPGLVYWYKE